MSNTRHATVNLTAARRSSDVCGMDYRDIADHLIGSEPALAEAVLRLGSQLDELDRRLVKRLDGLRDHLDGTAQQRTGHPQHGNGAWATGLADQLLDRAVERDGVLGEFEAVLVDAARLCCPNSGTAENRPVIRFDH